MSFTYGFYNSVNHDRKYNATQLSSIFDGIILDGVYMTIGDKFMVRPSEDDDSVIIGSGRAWFNRTWSYNDTDFVITGEMSELSLDRIDAVVLEINSNQNYRKNELKWITGVPSLTPQKPILIHTHDQNQYPLAYITRKANVTKITASQIENAVGTSETPFVTGVLEGMNIDGMIQQWRAQWDEFYAEKTQEMEDTTEYWELQWENWFFEYTVSAAGSLETWMVQQKQKFITWYESINEYFDEEGNVVNIVSKIVDLDDRVTNLEDFRDSLKYEHVFLYPIEDQNGQPITDNNEEDLEGAIHIVVK